MAKLACPVCKDHLGNDLTYAIVYNDETSDMIQSTLSSPEFAGLDEKQIGEEMNLLLGDKYKMEQNFDDCNFERAFLSQLTGSNISLYKADSGLTGWSQLEINSANNTVNEIPCN